MTALRNLALATLLCLPMALSAQSNINIGGITVDPTEAVEISADNLTVEQESGTAIFSGNVVVGQGDLRISAGRVEVVYAEAAGEIAQLRASGGVTFATATEAAEADSASYDLAQESLVLSGEVLLTQGATAISADEMRVDLASGNATLSGRVRTVIQQGGE